MATERKQGPPNGGDPTSVGWVADGGGASSGGPGRGRLVRLGWAAFGWLVGLWVASAFVLWNVVGEEGEPIPDWPFVLAALLPIVTAVAFGARGPAIVGSRWGRVLLVAAALAPFAAVAYIVLWALS